MKSSKEKLEKSRVPGTSCKSLLSGGKGGCMEVPFNFIESNEGGSWVDT